LGTVPAEQPIQTAVLRQIMREDIKSFITSVAKPGRYSGGETGSVFKDPEKVKLRVAFCFPDVYEIGMSNLGMRILCGCLNALDEVWCERVYAPWTDMAAEMEKRDIPLFTHESGDPVGEFDIAAFTMQYELCYTTMLRMLKMAKIPLRREERGEEFPVILAGGPCSYNPEPMADFVDIFSIGEGEEALPELARLYLRMKEEGTYTKKAFLYAAATELTGFYVPSLYAISYCEDGTVAAITPADEKVPATVTKRVVADFDKCYIPTDTVIPYIETVQDRVSVEIMRGCIRGCRFCQAGFVTRPVRERSPELLNEACRTMIQNSGYSEISMCTLSVSDYSKIRELTDQLLTWTDDEKVSLSLPSMRADSFTRELMEKISSVRSSTLTFAPEAGSQRLRDVINKNITEEAILRAAGVAYAAGKNQVKLYFMNGLPFETYEDLTGIAELSRHVVDEYYRTPNRNKARQPQVTLSVACFIPKPHTPFQWERQNTFAELEDKQRFLSEQITDRKIRYNYHDAKVSHIEAVLARGDRKLGKVLEAAVERGMWLDAWEEQFCFADWMQVFADCGIDPAFYANRVIPDEEILPWDMIDCGVSKEFLLRERHKAAEAAVTPSCREKCSGCGVNRLVDKTYCRWCPGHPESSDSAGDIAGDYQPKPKPELPPKGSVRAVRTVRVRFAKTGPALYISHLDLSKVMTRCIVRSGLPVYYTEGFNPIPKLVYATPLSVGCGGEEEVLDIRLMKDVSNAEVLARLRETMAAGIIIKEVYTAKGKISDIQYARNRITYGGFAAEEYMADAINDLFRKPVVMLKKTKSGEKEVDICTFIRSLEARTEDGHLVVDAVTAASQENFLNPEYIAAAIEREFAISGTDGYHTICRRALLLEDGETSFR